MNVKKLADLDVRGKRVMIRQDLNVPIKNGAVANDNRIRASLPSIRLALDKGAAVILLSHLGRPTEGEFQEEFSLKPVAERLSELLGSPVPLIRNWLDGVDVKPGQVVLCENVRMNKGEKKNNEDLGRRVASLCDVFVMDAFGAAHRAEATTHAAALFAPVVCAGVLMAEELDALGKALESPARPLVAIVGGAKVSTKLTILDNLSAKVDTLIVGGGIANNILAALGKNVGKSLLETEMIEETKRLLAHAGSKIPVPVDVVCAKELSETASPYVRSVDQVADDDMILDIGPETVKLYVERIRQAGTLVWNGPVGVFEQPQFAAGTKALGEAIVQSKAFSIVGGGDVVAAVEQFGLAKGMSYISTAGGAFLEFLEGKKLPAVAVLEERATR